MRILDVGCGINKKAGAIGLDRNPASRADVLADLDHFPYPFRDSSFDGLQAIHVIEHVSDVIRSMEEFHRLVRDGAVELLEVNGTVVGAFPFSQYDESRVQLRSGDLLVCYTDGVTEPENEYGEMFGEERLMELLLRNSQRPEEEIIQLVLDSVKQWTGSEELQDDMTLLLARRV